METNGIANILAVAAIARLDGTIDEQTYNSIVHQCDILERYMFAMHDVIEGARKQVPFWHEVKADPEKYRCTRQG